GSGGGGKGKRSWLPTLHVVRHGSKAVTRHWKPMHLERQKLMAVTEYIPPKPAIPERCLKPLVKKIEEETGYERLVRRQAVEAFRESRMITVCQYNSLSNDDMLMLRHQLRKHNIHVKFFPNEIIIPFLLESKYVNLLPLFVGRNIVLVSPETKAKEMLRMLKRVPQIVLLGACIENTILSKEGVVKFSKLPSLEVAQGEMVGTLSLVASQTSSLLCRSSLHLTALLDQYVKQQSNGTGETNVQAEMGPAESSQGV
uniref:Large ribosomal subunit protein uL10m n=1 Tax=Sphenodon punctatus TaxID=8508 RepID=A0A8D0HRK2_SPHPU